MLVRVLSQAWARLYIFIDYIYIHDLANVPPAPLILKGSALWLVNQE